MAAFRERPLRALGGFCCCSSLTACAPFDINFRNGSLLDQALQHRGLSFRDSGALRAEAVSCIKGPSKVAGLNLSPLYVLSTTVLKSSTRARCPETTGVVEVSSWTILLSATKWLQNPECAQCGTIAGCFTRPSRGQQRVQRHCTKNHAVEFVHEVLRSSSAGAQHNSQRTESIVRCDACQ